MLAFWGILVAKSRRIRFTFALGFLALAAQPLEAQLRPPPAVGRLPSVVKPLELGVRPLELRTIQPRQSRRHSNAPVIGALIGAIAVPGTLYLLCRSDTDCGTPSNGGLLLGGALGAFLGLIVGLRVRG